MKRYAIFAGVLAFSQPLLAADLLQTYREARANDPVYASARAAFEAGKEKLPQGLSLLLPTLNANGNTTWNNNPIIFRNTPLPGPYTRLFNSNSWTVTLTQPLFRMQNWMQYKQAEFQVAQAAASFGQAEQDLIVRVSQAYFDVLASQDSLAFIQAQKTAISEQLAQAKRNFEVGTATITDTHEAQARFDLATSQEIGAQNDLEIKQRALQQLLGKFPGALTPLRSSTQLNPPQPNAMEQWVETANKQNFSVQIQEAALEIAVREVQRSRAGHLPTLDLVGTYGETAAGVILATTSGLGYDTRGSTVGVQLTVPLYAGGSIDSRTREAAANKEKARQDLENARRSAALAVRQAYLGVTSGMAQVRALEQALVSSQSALDSNKLGYEVGVRINIDVLNAQQQLFSTMRDLSKARYDTLLNGLKLKAAAGALTEEDLETVNRLLGTG
jgi:outer membrane protein